MGIGEKYTVALNLFLRLLVQIEDIARGGASRVGYAHGGS